MFYWSQHWAKLHTALKRSRELTTDESFAIMNYMYLSIGQHTAAAKHYNTALYQCNGYQSMATRFLVQEFDIKLSQGRNIKRIVEKLEAIGSVANASKSGRPNTATNEAKCEIAANSAKVTSPFIC